MREITQYILAAMILGLIVKIAMTIFNLEIKTTQRRIEELLGLNGIAISVMKLPDREYYQAVACDWEGNVMLEGELSKTAKGAIENLLKIAKKEGLIG